MSQNQAALQGKFNIVTVISAPIIPTVCCCANSNYCNVGSASITTGLSGMLNILHPNQNCLAWLKIFVLASLCKLQQCCQVNRSHLHCHLRHRWQSIVGVDINGLLQECGFHSCKTGTSLYPRRLESLKAGFHMIADDRRSQKVLRSSAIIWKHTSASLRSWSQKIEPCSIFCDRLRSYGNQSSAICDRNVSHNIFNSDRWFNASKP